jgi:hypothetical protein
MMDNGRNSEGSGSRALHTACRPGQRLNWVVYAIDVQTPVTIIDIAFTGNKIAFEVDEMESPETGEPESDLKQSTHQWFYWSGKLPWDLKSGLYPYRLTLQMGQGRRSVMHSELAALKVEAETAARVGE